MSAVGYATKDREDVTPHPNNEKVGLYTPGYDPKLNDPNYDSNDYKN